MRPDVDRGRVEQFLEALGREVRAPVRLYLVGGATMVWLGLRPKTVDIDIAYEVDPRHHGAFIDAVRRLKERLQINVEEASPGDFIPLPKGHRDRAVWVGRYGSVDVSHFDPISGALSKIERGRESDLDDVRALIGAGHVVFDDLERAYEEILPRIEKESLKRDPDRFRRHFEALRGSLTP